MTEREFQAYKEKAIAQDVLSVENRIRHAFNQGVECGRKLQTQPQDVTAEKFYENSKRVTQRLSQTIGDKEMTWIINDKGEKIAFDDVPIDKVLRILDVFADREDGDTE